MLTDKQKAKRFSGLGSSDISAVAGENPFKGPHEVWLQKLQLIDDPGETDATWLGHQMEPVIARRYIKDTGIKLRRGHGTRRHSVHSHLLATIDFYGQEPSGEPVIVEAKWVGGRVMYHWNLEADGAPPYVQLQVQHQMGVLGYKRADVAVIFGMSAEFRIYQFSFDPEIFAALAELGRRFWHDRVLAKVPPPIDETESARQSLLAIYGKNRAPLKDAPAEADEWFAKRVDACARLEQAEKDKALATNKLCELIGEHEGIRGDGWYATWKNDKNGKRCFRAAEFKQKGRKAA